MPSEVSAGFNWGAFWLGWIWAIGNNVCAFLMVCFPPFGNIYLGMKGNELAWLSRKWDSVEQFKQTQAVWARCGWIVFFIYLVPFVTVMGLFVLTALGVGATEGMDISQ